MPGPFENKEIVLGVTGSIAAYKACEIASRLIEAGARVTPVLTQNAKHFIGALSLEAITGRHAVIEMFEPVPSPDIEHIEVARRAHLFIIAPASANIIAKAAHGLADDWLSTTLLATKAPVLFAPAMNTRMYEHPATQANIALLRTRGAHFVGPGEGSLACGETGLGRLIEIPAILETAGMLLCDKKELEGKHVLITSGGNHETIDPVRFIGNRSSGKMGRALAIEALRRGARVTMVTGPSRTPIPFGAETVAVKSAREMLDAVLERFAGADVFIAAAAVADYRVENPQTEKFKRDQDALGIHLVPNPDIAATVGRIKRPDQITAGFAAETQNVIDNAVAKMREKNLNLIVANEVGGLECAIGADASKAWLISPDFPPRRFPRITKEELAERIFDKIAALLPASPAE